MKKYIYIFCLTALTLGFAACSSEKLDGESIFVDEDVNTRNEFDKWLYNNYTLPYNIKVYYKMPDIETNFEYTVAPPDYQKAIELAHIIKYTWLDAYQEVAGRDFVSAYVPKVLMMIGSPEYQGNGTMVLGTAEGGLKITLNVVNSLTMERDFLNEYYLKTMHHEFSHILHQTKSYDPSFKLISEGHYVSGDWYYKTDTEAHQGGFVSPYASSEANEDIAELTCIYVTKTEAEWDNIMADAGEDGGPVIEKKIDMVKRYMKESWGISMDKLRSVVQRRINDVVAGRVDLDSLN